MIIFIRANAAMAQMKSQCCMEKKGKGHNMIIKFTNFCYHIWVGIEYEN